MSIQHDYVDLKNLEKNRGYQLLENEWLHQVTEVEKLRSKAARGKAEGNWKWYAGYEEGFKLAMTARQRALLKMEETLQEERKSEAEKLLEEMRPK